MARFMSQAYDGQQDAAERLHPAAHDDLLGRI
jgi:hypothetical protein